MHRKINFRGHEIREGKLYLRDHISIFLHFLMKGVDHLDGEYIGWKLEENFELISLEWKKDIKAEILKK
jgi:hypothetical protein